VDRESSQRVHPKVALVTNGYSRPNKPVNELVSLEIIKHLMGLSDEELEYAYLFDFRVRNALGKETLGDNICSKTFTNFRSRLLEYEEDTGHNLLREVFEDNRNYLKKEFEIDGSTQRMDSTFIEANIKQLSRIDLIAKVVHNFLGDLPEEIVQELPAGMKKFADTENLDLSYRLEPGEIQSSLETLVEHAAWLVDRFETNENYADLKSFTHLQQVLDEQCYQISELEDDDLNQDEDDTDHDQSGDSESPDWEPLRTFTSIGGDTEQHQVSDDTAEKDEHEDHHDRVGLKQPDEIDSGSLQNPHDDEATHRRKKGENHYGYKANIAETCGSDNPFRLITTVRVDTNNTDDGDLLKEDVTELPYETGLIDLLVDGGYTHHEAEACCRDHGITQHFSGITGGQPSSEKLSLADAEWDGHKMVACPTGHEPFEQQYTAENKRYSGRLDTEVCGTCPHKENCFVQKQQQFYSYSFHERKLEIARRRKRLEDPEEQELLRLRAGAESMINEVYHQDREKTRFTGMNKVKNASIAKAIGTNLKRASRFLESEAKAATSAG
jgi:hypothetical protein